MLEHLFIAMIVLLGPSTGTLAAEQSAAIELAAPRPAGRGEAFQVQITAGPLPRGARLVLLTENGETLGAVAPFPPSSRSTAVTVPVPQSAVADGRLRLRLQVVEPGAPPRPPLPAEVERIDLIVVRQSE
jgi:hypothetical protein